MVGESYKVTCNGRIGG